MALKSSSVKKARAQKRLGLVRIGVRRDKESISKPYGN